MTRLRLSTIALALLSLAACKDKSGGDAPAASGSAAAPASATSVAVAAVSCDAVIANVATMTKVDDAGKKLFAAICEGEPQPVRACMVAAKTMKDFDACDPHPLKGAMKSSAPELTAADLVDTDLSAADPAWKGWAAKGPKDGTVMADGVHGARIAAKRVDAFDVSFAPRKTKLADKKKGVQTGAKIMGDDVKITFVTDTADKLEWTTEVAGSKSWRFAMNLKVSGKDVTCTSGTMGAGTESLNALIESSCQSLHKK
jgi:hypothetical protein